ncbi:MAG: YceI family protein [Alphaproteobacteria bacterium]|nr:YceI family protein [Alphaproteobacteria bacterium]
MIRKISTLALGAAVALTVGVSGVQAAPMTYTLDNPHTQIVFSVSHLGFSHSMGKFTDYEGKFIFDPENPTASAVDVTIKAASVDLAHDKWNDHLKNADFFNVEKFPTITFKSTKIDTTGEKTADITGDLTILGVTKPVVLKTVYNKTDKHPYSGKMVAGFSATASIKRSDFGMTYGLPGVADDVNIMLEVEGIQDEATASTPATE